MVNLLVLVVLELLTRGRAVTLGPGDGSFLMSLGELAAPSADCSSSVSVDAAWFSWAIRGCALGPAARSQTVSGPVAGGGGATVELLTSASRPGGDAASCVEPADAIKGADATERAACGVPPVARPGLFSGSVASLP